MKARRRRGLVLLALALASGGLAASQVRQHEQNVEARVGPLVPVLVAGRNLPADSRIGRGSLALRRVPARYVPPDALRSTAGVAGARTAAAVPAGAYLTAGHLDAGGADGATGPALSRGERAVEVAVTGGGALVEAAPGARVDAIVSTETREGEGRTFVALEDVELLGVRGGGGTPAPGESEGAAQTGTILATLRVTLRQAVYLAAAENFSREIRLLVRPVGDETQSGRTSIAEGEL